MKPSLLIFLMLLVVHPLCAQDFLKKGLDAYAEEDYKTAFKCFSEHLELYPNDATALYCRAVIYEHNDDLINALSDINRGIEHYGRKTILNREDFYYLRGTIYQQAGMNNKAIEDFSVAIKYNPKKITYLLDRAQVYYENGNYDASNADYQQAYNLDNTWLSAAVGLARNLIAQKEYEKAIMSLSKLTKLQDNYGQIYRFRSQAFAALGEYTKAIDDVISWEVYDDEATAPLDSLQSYAIHAYTYALAKVSATVIAYPDDINWLLARAKIYEMKERYSEALNDYNAIENKLEKEWIGLYYHRGNCYKELGLYDLAIQDYTKAIVLKESADFYALRADAKRLNNEFALAINDFSKAITLDPLNGWLYYRRGWVKEKGADYSGALQDYTTGIELNKDYAYTYLTRGKLYHDHLQQSNLAQQDWQAVLEIEKDTIRERGNSVPYALFYLNRWEDAEKQQTKILTEYPNSSNYYDATCLYSLMSKPKQALLHLKIAFEKGYRDFKHIEVDDDLDNIRITSEFQNLVKEWQDKTTSSSHNDLGQTQEHITKTYTIAMKALPSGVYEVPCKINDLPLKFILDTGASDVTISSTDAKFMLKNNYLHSQDIIGKRRYLTASGDIIEWTKIKLRKIQIGELELRNVEASIVHNQDAPLLLGQSVLKRLGRYNIDSSKSILTIMTSESLIRTQ